MLAAAWASCPHVQARLGARIRFSMLAAVTMYYALPQGTWLLPCCRLVDPCVFSF